MQKYIEINWLQDIDIIQFNSMFIMKQNVYQILCICQHIWVEDNEVLRFQWISAKRFNVKKSQIELVFATVCNAYCIIHCKI